MTDQGVSRRSSNAAGFSLEELLVVFLIIAVTAGTAVPGLLAYLRNYRLAAAGVVFLGVLEAAVMTLPAYSIGLAIDRIFRQNARVGDGVIVRGIDALQTATIGHPNTASAEDTVVFFGLIVASLWVSRWVVAASVT